MGLTRQGWSIDLIATDLSGEVIERAEAGLYAPCEIERGLDSHALRYFRREGTQWRVDDALRRMVTFRRFNLMDSFGWLDDLDIIFCRNVLMYFDTATRQDVLDRMDDALVSDGMLVLGDSESPEHAGFRPSPENACIHVRKRAVFARAI